MTDRKFFRAVIVFPLSHASPTNLCSLFVYSSTNRLAADKLTLFPCFSAVSFLPSHRLHTSWTQGAGEIFAREIRVHAGSKQPLVFVFSAIRWERAQGMLMGDKNYLLTLLHFST